MQTPPDYLVTTLLADITLDIPEYYWEQHIPNLAKFLQGSASPFVYLRNLSDDPFCIPPTEFFLKYLCPETVKGEGDAANFPILRIHKLDLSHRKLMAMFGRIKSEISTIAQLLNFQWWIARHTWYHHQTFQMIHGEIQKRNESDQNPLDLLMESYVHYHELSENSWDAVWAHAIGDVPLCANLLSILNLHQLEDITIALPLEIFIQIDLAVVLVFSLDVGKIHPGIRTLILRSGRYFASSVEAMRWASSDGSDLLLRLSALGDISPEVLTKYPHIYQMEWERLSNLLGWGMDTIGRMMEMASIPVDSVEFYKDVLPLYPGLPVAYLVQIFLDHGSNAEATIEYLVHL